MLEKDKIVNDYKRHLLRHAKAPLTVFVFCEDINIREEKFYSYFNSFKSLEKYIWNSFFVEMVSAFSVDEEYSEFTAHEKILSFYYALIEKYKQNRSLLTLRFSELNFTDIRPWFLESFRNSFNIWLSEVLELASDNNEITIKPLLTSAYDEAIWIQFLYITKVFIDDESKEFQISEMAIEKTTALVFELLRQASIDLLIDFIKFAYQNKAY